MLLTALLDCDWLLSEECDSIFTGYVTLCCLVSPQCLDSWNQGLQSWQVHITQPSPVWVTAAEKMGQSVSSGYRPGAFLKHLHWSGTVTVTAPKCVLVEMLQTTPQALDDDLWLCHWKDIGYHWLEVILYAVEEESLCLMVYMQITCGNCLFVSETNNRKHK